MIINTLMQKLGSESIFTKMEDVNLQNVNHLIFVFLNKLKLKLY